MATKRKINETTPAVLEDLDTVTTELTEPAPKKAPVKREDPVVRAARLLEEAKAKAKIAAAKQLETAEYAVVLSESSLLKALKVYNERRDRVIALKDRLEEDYEPPVAAPQLLFGLSVAQISRALFEELPEAPEEAEGEHPLTELVTEVSDLQDRVDTKAA